MRWCGWSGIPERNLRRGESGTRAEQSINTRLLRALWVPKSSARAFPGPRRWPRLSSSMAFAISGAFARDVIARRHPAGPAKLSFRVAPHRVVAEGDPHDAEKHFGVVHHSGKYSRVAARRRQHDVRRRVRRDPVRICPVKKNPRRVAFLRTLGITRQRRAGRDAVRRVLNRKGWSGNLRNDPRCMRNR